MPIPPRSLARRLMWLMLAVMCAGAGSAVAGDGTWRGLGETLFVPIGQGPDRPTAFWPGALVQDSRGFIWGGSETGLERWDGYRFRLYGPGRLPDDGLRNHYFLALHVDAAGTMWVGTNTGELARYDPRTDRFTDQAFGASGAAAPAVWAIQDDGAGGIWVATGAGLYRLNAQGRTVAHAGPGADGGLPDAEIKALLRDHTGTMWAGGRGGLARMVAATGRFVPIGLQAGAGQTAEVTRLIEDSAGRIWIGTRQCGAFVLAPGETVARAVRIPNEDQLGARLEITAMAELAPGTVWLGTFGSGIVEVAENGTVTRRIRHDPMVPGGLDKDSIYSMFRDRAGLLWVATTGGLSLYRAPQGFVTMAGNAARRTGLTTEDVTATLSKPDGSVWLGSERGGVVIIDPAGRQTRWVDVQRVQCMADTADGGAVIGTRAGLFRLDAAARRLTRLDIPGRSVTAATSSCFTEGDIVWVGGSDDGLWQVRLGAGSALTALRHLNVPVLTNTHVEAIGASPDGRLAVGMQDGFMLVNRATGAAEAVMSVPNDPQSMSPGQVASFLTDRAGRLWVGTNSAGLSVAVGRDGHNRPRFQRLGLADGLPDADINAMLMDAKGRIWASTDDGLAEIDPVSLRVRAFRAVDGVAIPTYWNASGVVTRDGALLFGGVGGLTAVQPDLVRTWNYRPPVVVSDIRVGLQTGDALDADGFITVQPWANTMSVEFSALDYSASDMNRYRYRLDGYETDWVTTDSAHRVAAYTNLPPGDYKLELQGSNRAGIWSSSPAVVRVHVLAAWFQTLWFKALGVAAAALGVGGLMQARTFVLRQRQRELERQVSERTAQLIAKQAELHEIAYVDSLTGLANRRSFNETIARMLGAKAPGPFALLLIDLDGFKAVNDTLGHDAGDAVLLAASDRLREGVRTGDFVARLGGDEFAILLAGAADSATVDLIAERVTKSVAGIGSLGGATIKLGASIGAALFPLHGCTQEELYKRADTALYSVKRSGRGFWRIYDAALKVG